MDLPLTQPVGPEINRYAHNHPEAAERRSANLGSRRLGWLDLADR